MRSSLRAATALAVAALASAGCPAPTPPVDVAPPAPPAPPSIATRAAIDPSRSADQLAKEGIELGKRGELIDAIVLFEAALERDPRHVSAQFNLGVTFQQLGRSVEAEKAFAAFVQLRPDDVTGLFALARLQNLTGRAPAVALGTLERAVKAGFDDPVALKDGGFERLQGDLRYLAIEATVAQRAAAAGRPVSEQDFAREGATTNYGGVSVPGLKLPGVRNAGDCKRAADGTLECAPAP